MASTYPPREPMRNVDKAWLDMDTPTNHMIINGVMLFDAPIDYERFVHVIEERFVRPFRRFRQRIVDRPGPGGVAWEIDPHFDLRLHVRRLALPAPGDTQMLQALVSDLISESLDPNRPLWRFHMIEGVNGGCAVFVRLHHCIADGIALVQVLLSLTDDQPDAPASAADAGQPQPDTHKRPALAEPEDEEAEDAPPRSSAYQKRKRGFSLRDSLWRMLAAADSAGRLARSAASFTLHEGAQTATNPHHLVEAAYTAGLISVTTAAILGKLLLLSPDNDSAFKGNLGARKRVVWSEPVELERVKEIGRANGATINDILVAAVAGALRRYMVDNGGAVDIRAMIPVNLRNSLKPLRDLGNEFALVYLNLPLTEPVAERRLRAVKRQMDMLKQSPEPLLIYEILNVIGLFPGEMAEWTTTWFSTKASAVMTNVPGPRNQLYFCGQPMRRIMFWVPQSGRIGVGISIISYFGQVSLGVMVDEGLIAEPNDILAAFEEELNALDPSMSHEQGEGSDQSGDDTVNSRNGNAEGAPADERPAAPHAESALGAETPA